MSEMALIHAAKNVLHAWDAEHEYDEKELQDPLQDAMEELRSAVRVIREVVP